MLKPLLLVICLPFRSFGRSIENNRCFCIRKWLQQKHWGEGKRVKGRTGRWKQGGGGWEKGARRRGHRAAQAEADCLRDQVVFMLYPIHEGEMSVRNVACHAPHLHPYLLVYHTEPAPPAFSSVSHMAQVSISHGPSPYPTWPKSVSHMAQARLQGAFFLLIQFMLMFTYMPNCRMLQIWVVHAPQH